jgi:hypothetical protein
MIEGLGARQAAGLFRSLEIALSLNVVGECECTAECSGDLTLF